MFEKNKKFSVVEKVDFYKKRISNPKSTENQKIYARFWLNGFFDENADFNINGYKAERERYKSAVSKNGVIPERGEICSYNGVIAGATTQLKNPLESGKIMFERQKAERECRQAKK